MECSVKTDNQQRSRSHKWLHAMLLLGFLGMSDSVAAGDAKPCHAVSVPPLDAAQALERLARQTGVKIIYPYDLARSRQARAVAGCLTVDEAMAIMLQGSGLISLKTEAGALTIVEGKQQPNVTQGNRAK